MDNKLNNMIASSDITLKETPWFTRKFQRELILSMSSKMVVDYDVEPEEAIARAQSFCDAFYKIKIDPDTRK